MAAGGPFYPSSLRAQGRHSTTQYGAGATQKTTGQPNRLATVSGLQILPSLSFIAKFEELQPDFNAQTPRDISNPSTGFFLPPDQKNGCKRTPDPAQFYRWKGGRMTKISENEAFQGANSTRKRCATMFTQKPYTDHLFVVLCNATEDDARSFGRSWQTLTFNHEQQPPASVNKTYSSVAYGGSETHLAAHGSASWMEQVLPREYDYCLVETNGTGSPIPPETASAGLTGDLALLLGLAAYSAPPNFLQAALTTSMEPNVWIRHGFPNGRIRDRGMIVSIYLDPANTQRSTPTVLKDIEEGRYGPFYGP